MAIKALRGVSVEWYTPEDQRDDDSPTKFLLKPLTPPELEQVMEALPDGSIGIPISNYSRVLKLGLKDWENFTDDEDKPIKATFVNHYRIPQQYRIELGAQILALSHLSGEDAGN